MATTRTPAKKAAETTQVEAVANPHTDPDETVVVAQNTTVEIDGVPAENRNANDLSRPLHIPDGDAKPIVLSSESYEDALDKGFLGTVTRSPDRANETSS